MSDARSLPASASYPKRPFRPSLGLRRGLLNRIAGRLSVGSLTVQTPLGERLVFESATPQPIATLVLHRSRTLSRVLLDGDIGFAEAYLDGDWSSPDMPALIELVALNDKGLGAMIDGALPRRLVSLETFGQSYARTLAAWNGRFQAVWPKIEAMGFSPRFKRMWEYYLAYCEGGFTAGAIDVGLYKIRYPA